MFHYVKVVLWSLLLTIASSGYAQDVKTYIPAKAIPLVPVYKEVLIQTFQDIPQPWYTLALTEHESCISLKHSKCFSSTAKLETYWKDTGYRREFGGGLGQLTRAWKPDGTIRMDTLANLKKIYPKELAGLTWDNLLQRPDLQIKAMVLLLREDYKGLSMIPDPVERLKFADSAYNGGRRDALGARKACGLTQGCDPNIWFNHTEKHCVKSKRVLYANRSACDINTHHVSDVFKTRMPKYKPLLPDLKEDK